MNSLKIIAVSALILVVKYLRFQFGSTSASERFQKLTSKYVGGIKNVNVYFDYILVSGATEEEHA